MCLFFLSTSCPSTLYYLFESYTSKHRLPLTCTRAIKLFVENRYIGLFSEGRFCTRYNTTIITGSHSRVAYLKQALPCTRCQGQGSCLFFFLLPALRRYISFESFTSEHLLPLACTQLFFVEFKCSCTAALHASSSNAATFHILRISYDIASVLFVVAQVYRKYGMTQRTPSTHGYIVVPRQSENRRGSMVLYIQAALQPVPGYIPEYQHYLVVPEYIYTRASLVTISCGAWVP